MSLGARSEDPRRRLGLDGEAQAEALLLREGFRILDRRFRCKLGEIDLIALDGDVVVFVEVKARRGVGFGTPVEGVSARQQRRLARAALWWLARNDRLEGRSRFDVVEVLAGPGSPRSVRRIEDAFRPAPVDPRGRGGFV